MYNVHPYFPLKHLHEKYALYMAQYGTVSTPDSQTFRLRLELTPLALACLYASHLLIFNQSIYLCITVCLSILLVLFL